jgi:glycosyltransferase involved in cell wall biosynthesis
LAIELASLGHRVALISNNKESITVRGVECPGYAVGQSGEYFNSFDAVVVLGASCAAKLRGWGVKTKLYLWTGHTPDQPAVSSLQDRAEKSAWDGFFMVSNWQKATYIRAFDLDATRVKVLPNAMAPAFEKIERTGGLYCRREDGPILAYTSTPFRGLDVLLLAFSEIRAALPTCRLRVYSGMQSYNVLKDQDPYTVLYELSKVLPGVEYVGPLSQPALAQELSKADILAYPNTFVETSCISCMEAMGAGLTVISSNLGALSETAAGFGVLIPVSADHVHYAKSFASIVVGITQHAHQMPDLIEKRLNEQMEYARTHYSWKARARDWEKFL